MRKTTNKNIYSGMLKSKNIDNSQWCNTLKEYMFSEDIFVRLNKNTDITISKKNEEKNEENIKKQISKTISQVKEKNIKERNFFSKDKFVNYLINIIKDKNTNTELLNLFNFTNKELSFKDKTQLNYYYVDKLQKLKKDIKDKKTVKPTLFKVNEVIIELGNTENMSLVSFIACCYIEKINLFLLNKQIGSYIQNDNINTSNPKLYLVDIHKNIDNIIETVNYDDIYNKYYLVENILKPFKSVSYYKINDIVDICELFDIDVYKKEDNNETKKKIYTKPELYTKLIQYSSI